MKAIATVAKALPGNAACDIAIKPREVFRQGWRGRLHETPPFEKKAAPEGSCRFLPGNRMRLSRRHVPQATTVSVTAHTGGRACLRHAI
ncbi:hypothetical protein BGC31_05095 [Komagataeibacter xylinus]|nr:hypothetical protein BGC31_05095 [Komagataeibacter xylinus]RFP04639.1 hypothetical protein BFX83_09735 [Komagataeibacter xylinus]